LFEFFTRRKTYTVYIYILMSMFRHLGLGAICVEVTMSMTFGRKQQQPITPDSIAKAENKLPEGRSLTSRRCLDMCLRDESCVSAGYRIRAPVSSYYTDLCYLIPAGTTITKKQIKKYKVYYTQDYVDSQRHTSLVVESARTKSAARSDPCVARAHRDGVGVGPKYMYNKNVEEWQEHRDAMILRARRCQNWCMKETDNRPCTRWGLTYDAWGKKKEEEGVLKCGMSPQEHKDPDAEWQGPKKCDLPPTKRLMGRYVLAPGEMCKGGDKDDCLSSLDYGDETCLRQINKRRACLSRNRVAAEKEAEERALKSLLNS